VHEAIASADPLKEQAFGAIVEQEVVAGWGVAVVPEEDAEHPESRGEIRVISMRRGSKREQLIFFRNIEN
jgi:hypothetical protein